MNEFSTPMMRQYNEIRKKYPDCLMFYRMGDFYELFMEDAHVGAKVLNLTLTGKAGGKDGRIPMAGIPYHAVDTYLTKLVRAGYKVAICEQLSPPGKKGLVERDVVRVVTPGTMLDENSLEKKENNYLVSILVTDDAVSLAAADLSTGYFAVSEHEGDYLPWLSDELARLSPSECILPDALYNDAAFLKFLKTQQGMNIYPLALWDSYAGRARKLLKEHFAIATLETFGIDDKPLSIKNSAALIGYLRETQKSQVQHIRKIILHETETTMVLDKSTTRNLEIFATLRDDDTRGSLIAVLDETVTAMGGRLLRSWLKKPLIDKSAITDRHAGVACFTDDNKKRESLRSNLESVGDIERLVSRLSVNIGNARDLMALKHSVRAILGIKQSLAKAAIADTAIGKEILKNISDKLTKVVERIERDIIAEPPIDIKSGGIIADGRNKELDALRTIIDHSRTWMNDMEQTERTKTGIASLKVRYNQVFGFYIEVSKSNLHLVPTTYERKQTLVNGERFVTSELKKHEDIILTAQEKANELEYSLYNEILSFVLSFTPDLQKAAYSIGMLDCIMTYAHISKKYRYVRPKLLYSGELRIIQGRHPVVERLLATDEPFVPNDAHLDTTNQSLLIITGPNMAGKSVLIRQVALIVLMNQIGCFVPAQSAHLSLVDRIFVRSGASDVITSGLSTFMVEMSETAHILHHATSRSLIIMDEIGRGTSTFDGISLAWAVAQYLVTGFSPAPKTLFATHYHELQLLEEKYPSRIKNFHMAVTGNTDRPVFLHTLFPGGASHSFGIAVAKLAGIPDEVLTAASDMLHSLESRGTMPAADSSTKHTSPPDTEIVKELLRVDVSRITPIAAMNTLVRLQEMLREEKVIKRKS